jgi:hypothetical protein
MRPACVTVHKHCTIVLCSAPVVQFGGWGVVTTQVQLLAILQKVYNYSLASSIKIGEWAADDLAHWGGAWGKVRETMSGHLLILTTCACVNSNVNENSQPHSCGCMVINGSANDSVLTNTALALPYWWYHASTKIWVENSMYITHAQSITC